MTVVRQLRWRWCGSLLRFITALAASSAIAQTVEAAHPPAVCEGWPPLLNALVFTGASASAKDALQRYLDTAARLIDWHLGDVFDPESKAFNSVSAVRSIHKGVRISMQSKFPGTHKLNMYNMATVQTGFMGALTVTPGNVFGLKASPEEISDYVYFWRCVGRQLGISDQYNLCGRGAQNSANIVHEIIDELILPGYSNQPPMYQPMAQAYIDGLNVNFLGLPVLTVPSTVAVFFWALGRPRPYSLSLLDSLRFYGMCVLDAFLPNRAVPPSPTVRALHAAATTAWRSKRSPLMAYAQLPRVVPAHLLPPLLRDRHLTAAPSDFCTASAA
eukprot:COSAG01_NODE_9599_length_2395_cov_1.369774_1_plen_330_part_00